MQITMEVLQKRRDDLSAVQVSSESELDILKDRVKTIKKEVSNIKGAVIEIDRLIEAHD